MRSYLSKAITIKGLFGYIMGIEPILAMSQTAALTVILYAPYKILFNVWIKHFGCYIGIEPMTSDTTNQRSDQLS
jgi:hypothetical protein